MKNNKRHNKINLSVRFYAAQRDLIERAAALVPGRTTADYVREVLPMQAALDLHEELPALPTIEHRPLSPVKQAAISLGMSVIEFKASAIRRAAEQVLGADVFVKPPAIPAPPSPRRPASGFFSSASPRPARTAQNRR